MTTADDAPTTLAALGEDARYARYEQLQERLPDVWRIMRLN